MNNINPHPDDHNGLVSIKYNKYNQKIVVKTKGDVTVNLYDRIAELFGFDEDDSIIWGTEKGSRVVDINLVNSMFLLFPAGVPLNSLFLDRAKNTWTSTKPNFTSMPK